MIGKNGPLIGVDVDDVVLDMMGELLFAIGGRLTPADIMAWDCFSFFTPEENRRATELMANPLWWASCLPYPGAQDAIEHLRSQHPGTEILWITSPWDTCFGWESVRKDWLKKHFDAKPEDVIFTKRKELVTLDLLIDDRASTIEKATEVRSSMEAWLVNRPWNQDCSMKRRTSRVEIRDGIFEYIEGHGVRCKP